MEVGVSCKRRVQMATGGQKVEVSGALLDLPELLELLELLALR